MVDQVLGLGLGSVPAKIVCAYLPPGKVIKPHKDGGQYYTFHNRIHVPLVTNPGVIMTVDREEYQMDVGSIYLFQNLRRHAARNEGLEARIHLILDVLDPRYSEQIYLRLWWPLMLNVFGMASGYRWLRSRNATQAHLYG
jgi:aspartyl/asparaginyl beta-hydroxylase (cupin superfamily)